MPPPRSYTAIVDPGSTRSGGGVVQRRGLRLGQERDRQALAASAAPSRSFLCAPHDAGWVTAIRVGRAALALGDPVDHPAHQPGGQLLGRPRPPADDDRGRVADPPLELAHDAVGIAGGAPLGGLADDDARRPSPTNSTEGTALDRSPRLTISVSAGQAPRRHVAAAVRVVPTSMPNR